MSTNAYDLVPYDSHAFSSTRPENLSVIARLFGLETADFATAKILELGCASGGNIIPLAELYPNSHFTGVDYSAKQIQAGQECIHALGLKNISLQAMSIADIYDDFGEFDFIIAHGVYSWVAQELQAKILQICQTNLAGNGVAYVSLNTLPGWNTVNTIREAMLYHTQGLDEPQAKVQQSRSMLEFLVESTASIESPHAQSLKDEMASLDKSDDYYVLHDYLEGDNHPVYFHEFMQLAQGQGLQYLADTELNSMVLDNFPDSVSKTLNGLGDVVQIEQYMDFIRNRRFRSTLLCHESMRIDRSIKASVIESLYLSSKLQSHTPITEAKLKIDGAESIFSFGEFKVGYVDRLSKLIHLVLIEQYERPIDLKTLCQEVRLLASDVDDELIKNHVLNKLNIVKLVFSGALTLHLSAGNYRMDIPDKPQTTELARLRARSESTITNCRHQELKVSPFERAILVNLDGQNTLEDISDKVLKEKKNFSAVSEISNSESVPISQEEMAKRVRAKLEGFAKVALLI
jgi:methyltransferase-like protein/cyclopropane fatty-acyl-phospholipid synthase-like methyltransferase